MELILTSHRTLWRRGINICESVRKNGNEHLNREKQKEKHTTIFSVSIASTQLVQGKDILSHEDKELWYAAAYDGLLLRWKSAWETGCNCVIPVSWCTPWGTELRCHKHRNSDISCNTTPLCRSVLCVYTCVYVFLYNITECVDVWACVYVQVQ